MARVAQPLLFRAETTLLPWGAIAGRLVREFVRGQGGTDAVAEWMKRVGSEVKARQSDVHLTWACARDLGMPRGAFTVWRRDRGDERFSKPERVTDWPSGSGSRVLGWADVAAVVRVTYTPVDPAASSGLFVYRTEGSVDSIVGAEVAAAGSGNPTTVEVRTSGATFGRLVNGSNPTVTIVTLADCVNDPAWKPLEIVGLPLERGWGSGYDESDQGLIAAPTSPIDAALDRLKRGMPPIGWGPVTQTGHRAPTWEQADPEAVVKEILVDLLPEIAPMYDPSVPERQQYTLEFTRAVDGPTQDGRMSTAETTAKLRPWSMLALPAQTDPVLNLALGFGATYRTESGDRPDLTIGRSDLMVTAVYERPGLLLRGGKAELAAYAPYATRHEAVPPPTTLQAERSGLVAPRPADQPWRESITVRWDRLTTSAALGRVTAGALARYAPSAPLTTPAEALNPPRLGRGYRPLTLSPDGPPDTPGAAKVTFVDGAAEIPIGSGGRSVGYAVSVVDLHGVWSPWRDVAYAGDEPAPMPPRLISARLDTRYAGSPSCPAELVLEAALDWTERIPTQLDVVAIFYPMATASSAPPAGVDPGAATPAGCFRRDLGLTFAGDVPTGSGCTVDSLTPDGDAVMTPGPGQGDGGRRYRLTAPVPTLDFASTSRWGVQVWLRSQLRVGASPTAYVPDAAHPARAIAASPVPVVPLPPPAPPGVPLGSTPDAQGCSHVRVRWSLPAGGAGVRTCVVWEVSETALRQRAGLPKAAETDSPGVRLAALWAAYDAMTPVAQRAAFRRLLELPGTARDADITLPKGSTDIHLFTVTTQSMTGIESPWPGPAASGHLHLQAAMAPRLRRPAPPLVRPEVGMDGTSTLRLYAASSVPVARFLVFATRSEAAARDRESMGPAVLTIPVVAAPAAIDPVTNTPIYEANSTLTRPPSWEPWLLRAVAEPVDTVPVEAVRGVPSPASDIVSVSLPPTTPPDLEPLTAVRWSADHRSVLIRTSTSAPVRGLAGGVGPHRISARVTGSGGAGVVTVVPLADLGSLPQVDLTAAPAGPTTPAGPTPVLERGARGSGRTPLALWFTLPAAGDAAEVSLTLVDPSGRATEHTLSVPPYVAPPAYTITIPRWTVRPTGVVVSIFTDAPRTVAAGFSLRVRASTRGPLGRPITITRTVPLAKIVTGKLYFATDGKIHIVRVTKVLPPGGPQYAAWVPLTGRFTVTASLLGRDGSEVSASHRF